MRAPDDQWKQDPIYTTQITGIREHTMLKDVAAFAIAEIVRPAPLPKLLALLTNHETIYLFNYDFSCAQQLLGPDWSESQCCRLKLDLRMTYKFQSFLYLKPTYSTNFECLFLILQGGQIAVFNEEIYLLAVLKLECCDPANKIKHSLDYQYLEKESWRQARKVKRGLFLFLFADSIEWHEVEIETNHKLSKFKPSYKFSLTQVNKKIIENRLSHPVGLEVFNYKTKLESASEKANDYIYLVCNCSTDVFFYLIAKDSMTLAESICLQGVGEGPSGVTSLAVGVVNQRAILGMCTGIVKVYSLKQQNRGKILFSIEVAHAPIQKVLWLKQKQVLITYSQDCYLSEVNFSTMTVEQRYRAGCYSALVLLNEKTMVGLGWKGNNSYSMQESTQDQFNKQLIFGQLSLNYHKVVELNSTITDACHFDSKHLLQLQDNSLISLGQGQNMIEVVRTYLPPNCVSVQSISRNIYHNQEYWLLTDKSEVYKYQFNSSGAQVAGVLPFSKFKDKHQTDHKFKINCLVFANKIVPLNYDSEITERQHPPNKSTFEELQPILLAASSGDLLIVSLKQPTLILFRLKKTEAPLLYIHELTPYFDRDPSRSVVVFGSAQQCFLVQISASKLPVELFRLDLSCQRIKMINSSILALTIGSNFNAYYFKEELNYSSPQCFRQEHYSPGLMGDAAISCFSSTSTKEGNFITTGYTLGQIIVWQMRANVLDHGYLQLHPLYLIENTNEHQIEYGFYSNKSVCFNLGRYFVKKYLQKPVECQPTHENRNFRIGKGNKLIEEDSPLYLKLKGQNTARKKPQKRGGVLPAIKSKGKVRSESVGLLQRDKKWQQIFHFPDSQLYRSIINNKSLLH